MWGKKRYQISNFEEDMVSPEETLIDSLSSRSKIELPISRSIIQVFYFLIGLVLFFYLFFSFRLGVLEGKDFRSVALSNRSTVYNIPSMRGVVLDSDGEVLAGNTPVFDLIAISADLPKKEEELRLWSENLAGILNDKPENIFSILQEKERQAVFFVKRDVAKEKVIQIQNHYQKGVFVVSGAKRSYSDSIQFSNILGYTGKVSQDDLKDEYYIINDRKGRSGLEEKFEEVLRGKHGQIFFDRANKRYVVKPASPGSGLVLNIDSDVQKALYDSVENVLRSVGLKAGSAVAQNPKTGEILGMVSFPSFDNSLFSSELSEELFKKYFENKNRPIFNRAVSGKYNPGSTIKPLLALAGLKENVISPETTIVDLNGYITVKSIYDPSVVYKFRDWKVQGTLNLKKAIAQSSDIYFYSVGGGYGIIKGLGFEKLEKYFRTFLIDKVLGIDISGEAAGFVPNEEWKLEKTGQPWFTGDTYNVSIGQGDLLVTPLWLSSYVSAIANGGTFYKPFLVKKIIDGEQKPVQTFKSEELAKLPFDTRTLDIVREAMREVVVSGTAQMLNSLPIKIAAKTGTAEVGVKGSGLNSVFVAYAPFDDPEIAISIVVEDIGQKQGLAVLAAKQFFESLISFSN
ncbi:MAG TPA: penicillin-binding protein 2 [Candidatus Paceibacterota bacterium]